MTGQEMYERYAQLQLELYGWSVAGWFQLDPREQHVWGVLAAVVATNTENAVRTAAHRASTG